MSELDLFPARLPSAQREEPRLWVKEVAIYRDWDPKELVRRVTLRRGLNIVWAEPSAEGAGGHAAGKTTFCRFLRYLLGDQNFGSDTFREAFKTKFPKAWLVGEIVLEGTPWLVARFIGISGPNPWSAEGAGFPQAFSTEIKRQTYAAFTRALHQRFIKPLSLDTLPGSGTAPTWPHLLAWLTRDQEARYARVLDWRAGESGSGGLGDLTHADRTLLVRSVLGLVEADELEARRKHLGLLRQKAEADALVPNLEFTLKRATDHYWRALGLPRAPVTPAEASATLHTQDLEGKRLSARLRKLRTTTGIDHQLKADSDAAAAGVVTAENELTAARRITSLLANELAFKQGKVTDEEYRKGLAALPLRADQCAAPLQMAVNCGIARSLHPNRFAQHHLDELASGVEAVQAQVEAAKRAEATLAAKAKTAIANREKIAERVDEVAQRHQELITSIGESLQATRDKASAAREVIDLVEALDAARATSKQLTGLLNRSSALQSKMRKAATAKQSEFSELFAALAEQALRNGKRGAVRFGADDIEPQLDYNDLTSTALHTLKLLLFDLAALFASARGSDHHPGFLLHDSPREADLSAAIYHQLFEIPAAQETDKTKSAFQYIITTTEPPPQRLCQQPWLVLGPLSSSDPERRLLKANL